MLVLSRRVEEEIVVGDDVRIRILRIDDGRVRVGVVAPVGVPVHRSEVRDRILVDAGVERLDQMEDGR